MDFVDCPSNKEQFPSISLPSTLGTNERVSIAHLGDVSKIASELKKRAKAMKSCVYVKDQRGPTVETPAETANPTKIPTAR